VIANPTSCDAYDDGGVGVLTCYYPQGIGVGRRPEGLVDGQAGGPDATARYLAQAAHLEAAAVHAFERLATELEAHGAPARLSRAARRAARDEARHTRVVGRLAEAAGASVAACQVAPATQRSLEAIALENAVEGCVYETYGAVVAQLQAEQAGDLAVRRAMTRVARDEMQHAVLSWAVARWLDTRLDEQARERVQRARDTAVRALMASADAAVDASLARRVGLPGRAQARSALGELRSSLWD
jgi:rubrerythrin